MEATIERALAAPRVDGRSWLRWGGATFAGVEAVHVIAGTALNDWEGWGTFFSILVFVVVSGLVIVGLVYGLLVRWGLEASPRGRNRAAFASLAAGLLSVAGYAVIFTWAHLLVAPAAVLLGRAGLTQAQEGRGGRAYALSGALIGYASFAFGATLLIYAILNEGNYPFLG